MGVEFAGEVRAAHPDKKIALISSGAQLIGSQYSSGLHNKLYSQLTSSGTKVILNESVDISGLSTGPIPSHTFKTSATATEIEADYLLNATGTKPDASLLSAADASAVDECGAARVDANLRVRSEMLRNVFAVGDATGAGSIMAAKPQTTALSASLLALVNAPKDKAEQVQLKEYKAPAVMIVVPLGPKGGASQLPWFSL